MVDVVDATAILCRTPLLLRSLYEDLPPQWLDASDPGEWSAHEVLVHLVTVEDHAWVQRLEHALNHPGQLLPAINREIPDSPSDPAALLGRFADVRSENLARLAALDVETQPAIHGVLGDVTTDHILATWAVHDLNHVAQALASIASRYRDDVGPFIPNLGILGPPPDAEEFEDA